MPLVAISDSPTYSRLRAEHHQVLPIERALHQDIRELHVGILNMMPDDALAATERQFMRLVGDCNQIVQFHVHLFTLDSIPRSAKAQQWIKDFYLSFDQIKQKGLDALVISGACPQEPTLPEEAFWQQLTEVIDWAELNVTSTLCACLATHAVLEYRYGITRRRLPAKQWGVFSHRLNRCDHPLIRHMNTRFDVPHSRFNEVTSEQLKSAGLHVLVESDKAGVQLATSGDGIKLIFLQGHPEYDALSLFKEFKREVKCWYRNQRPDYPPFPEGYFEESLKQKLVACRRELEILKAKGVTLDAAFEIWPEQWAAKRLDNTWRDTALSTFNNWLGLVYQLTDQNPKLPFMPGINPENPLYQLD